MQHLDEGTIHAWLDGALSAGESARVEAHVASCEACGAAVAEARGLVAASSRILAALDNVPRNVIPESGAHDAKRGAVPVKGGFRRWEWKRIAAVMAFVAVGGTALRIAVGEFASADRVMEGSGPPARASASAPAPEKTAQRLGATVASPQPAGEVTRDASGAPASTAAPTPPAAGRADITERAPKMEQKAVERDARQERTRTNLVPGPLAAPSPHPSQSVVQGRVIDATTGNGLPGAQVQIAGTPIGALTDENGAFRIAQAPEGEQQLRVVRFGYDVEQREIQAKAGETVLVDVAMQPAPRDLDNLVVTGEAAKPVSSTIVGLQALARDTVVENGRSVEQSVYELRPGVQVTLSVSTTLPAERDADRARGDARRAAPRAAAAGAELRMAPARQGTLRSLSWTSPAGAQVTLSGAVTEEELRRLRERVAVP